MATPTTDADQQAYALALDRLAQLQSNRAITSLFDTPAPAPGSGGAKPDLNALAIPEMLAWLRRAGYTPASLASSGLRCVHVAGTKGKGSVSALVASILTQYYRQQHSPEEEGAEKTQAPARTVGLYTSPHVLSVRERIALDGAPLGRAKFARYVHEVWDRLTEAAREDARAKAAAATNNLPAELLDETYLSGPATKPFYFRFLTLVALHAFISEGVRDAVVECGIGGEYDSTNILPAECVTACVVTQLGLDHVSMLGDTVAKIAWHKSGVCREGVRAFTRLLPSSGSNSTLTGRDAGDGSSGEGQAAQNKEVMEVLRARAQEKGATLVEVEDEEVDAWHGVNGARLQGPWQKHNMALAVHAAREHLLRMGVKLEGRFGTDEWTLSDIPPAFVEGLREASLPGRCEVLEDADGVAWHFDGAHTDDSLAGVGRWFAERTRGADESVVRILVFNQQERDASHLLRALLAGAQQGAGAAGQPVFTHAIFTRNEEQRPGEEEQRDLSLQTRVEAAMRDAEPTVTTAVCDSVQSTVEAVKAISTRARDEGKACKVLVTGSFHLVGPVLKTVSGVED